MSRELLFSVTKEDLDIKFYKASGKGGQNRNKRDTACRIVHRESGAVGMSADERSQLQNKKKAFQRLVESDKFKLWQNRKAFEVMNVIKSKEEIEKEVEEMIAKDLADGKILIEEI